MNATENKPARNRKKLLRTVTLRFFEDDANGEWGVTHEETMQNHGSDGFNAFWDGRGLFHDVFEHAHEFTDKHFLGLSAMNVGGEVAAMGSLWYFYNQCGMYKRLDNPFFGYQTQPPDSVTMDTTLSMMEEAIREGYANFGNTLESSVPNQKEVDDSQLETIIEEHFSRIQKCEPKENSDAQEYGPEYKKSVTLEKLQNLYRYGYRMAEKLFPNDDSNNGEILHDFVSFWNDFCKKNKAETLAGIFRKLVFKVYRDADGLCHWTAELVPMVGIPSDEIGELPTKFKGGPGVHASAPIVLDY